jgi:hypothetical protein
MLHIIYRSYGGENQKGRPEYYSKLLALMSFIRSFGQIKRGDAEVIFLNDGPIPPERLQVMQKSGEVLARSNLGSRGSWQNTLALPAQRGWPGDDLVWFAEDDYLYLPHALGDLIAAAEAYPEAAYFGLYAMVGSRLPNGNTSRDRVPNEKRRLNAETRLVHGHPWRSAISTTSTFGGRVKPLVEDRPMMELASRSGGSWDHTIALMYQGLMPYPMASLMALVMDREATKSALHRVAIAGARMGLNVYHLGRSWTGSGRRLLVAADPALITHLETAFMALGTDWGWVALDTRQWMDREGLAPADSGAALPHSAAAE